MKIYGQNCTVEFGGKKVDFDSFSIERMDSVESKQPSKSAVAYNGQGQQIRPLNRATRRAMAKQRRRDV